MKRRKWQNKKEPQANNNFIKYFPNEWKIQKNSL